MSILIYQKYIKYLDRNFALVLFSLVLIFVFARLLEGTYYL